MICGYNDTGLNSHASSWHQKSLHSGLKGDNRYCICNICTIIWERLYKVSFKNMTRKKKEKTEIPLSLQRSLSINMTVRIKASKPSRRTYRERKINKTAKTVVTRFSKEYIICINIICLDFRKYCNNKSFFDINLAKYILLRKILSRN